MGFHQSNLLMSFLVDLFSVKIYSLCLSVTRNDGRESENTSSRLEKASRLCELERDLSSYAVFGYTRTVENLSAL